MYLRHSGDLGEQEIQAVAVLATIESIFRRETMCRPKAGETEASQGVASPGCQESQEFDRSQGDVSIGSG